MIFKLICVGKLNSKNSYQIICNEYKKRIKDNLEIIEIKSDITQKSSRIKFEANKINEYLKRDKDIFLLDTSGKNYSSFAFSELFRKKKNNGCKTITFVIGGIYGLHETLIKKFSSISSGEMTWPHGLMRVLLLEQIYRAQTILDGHPYDK